MPLDIYAPGVAFIANFMIDECEIRRDPEGVYDEVLDTSTGLLISPEPDTTLVFSGQCLIKPMGTKDQSYDLGGQPSYRKGYNVLLPKTLEDVRIGDTITMVTVQHDEKLEGMTFRIFETRVSTHTPYRHIRVEDIQTDHNSTRYT